MSATTQSLIPTICSFVHSIFHPVFPQMFIKHLLCARHYSSHWGHNTEQDRTPALLELTFKRGVTGNKQMGKSLQREGNNNNGVETVSEAVHEGLAGGAELRAER